MPTARWTARSIDSRAVDIILTGDDHDLALFFDGRTVMVESKEEAEFVTAIDVKVDVEEKDGKRSVTWYPNFRIIDTATVTPDPETQALVDKYNAELSKELDVAVGITSESLDSRKATVRTSEAAIGNLVADAAAKRSAPMSPSPMAAASAATRNMHQEPKSPGATC